MDSTIISAFITAGATIYSVWLGYKLANRNSDVSRGDPNLVNATDSTNQVTHKWVWVSDLLTCLTFGFMLVVIFKSIAEMLNSDYGISGILYLTIASISISWTGASMNAAGALVRIACRVSNIFRAD